jgi:hypothetical protein
MIDYFLVDYGMETFYGHLVNLMAGVPFNEEAIADGTK